MFHPVCFLGFLGLRRSFTHPADRFLKRPITCGGQSYGAYPQRLPRSGPSHTPAPAGLVLCLDDSGQQGCTMAAATFTSRWGGEGPTSLDGELCAHRRAESPAKHTHVGRKRTALPLGPGPHSLRGGARPLPLPPQQPGPACHSVSHCEWRPRGAQSGSRTARPIPALST